VKAGFRAALTASPEQGGFGLPAGTLDARVAVTTPRGEEELRHGSVVIASITSCTNTSNASVMLSAACSPGRPSSTA